MARLSLSNICIDCTVGDHKGVVKFLYDNGWCMGLSARPDFDYYFRTYARYKILTITDDYMDELVGWYDVPRINGM